MATETKPKAGPHIVSRIRGGRPHSLEEELLLCCARTRIDAEMASRIRQLLQGDVDWVYLIKLATEHQIAPLLSHNLWEMFPDACPAPILDQLRSLLRANAARNIFLAYQLIKVVELLEAHGIPTIAYKGPILAESIYGNVALRWFVDLDVWVHPWNYHFRVTDELVAHGWQVTSEGTDWERTCTNPSGVQLDVHAGLASRHMPFRLDFDQVWNRCVKVTVAGEELKTFAPPDLLMVLCVQLSKDAGIAIRLPLIKVCDIAESVRSYQHLDWIALLREADSLGVRRRLSLGLLTADHMLGLAVPKHVWWNDQVVPDLTSLVTHIRERVLGETGIGYSRPDLLDGSRWFSEVQECLQDRVKLFREFFRAVTPNVRDYSLVRLPRALFPLYYLVRPIRLVRKHSHYFFRKIFPGSQT